MSATFCLPDYLQIRELVSKRSFVTAFKAQNTEQNSDVLIKSVRYPSWMTQNEQSQHRFGLLRTLQQANKISHRSIAPVKCIDEDREGVTAIRNWIDGSPLSDVLDYEDPMRPTEVVHLGKRIAEAIDHLAEVGLSHGNVNASNVLIRRSGGYVLTDPLVSQETSSMVIAGTPLQLSAASALQSDISALAELLHFALSGDAEAGDTPYWVPRHWKHSLDRAIHHPRAFATASSLMDALGEPQARSKSRNMVWPTASVGVATAVAIFGSTTMWELNPAPDRIIRQNSHSVAGASAPTTRPETDRTANPEPTALAAPSASIQPLAQPNAEALAPAKQSSDDLAMVSLMIRRKGVSALLEPWVTELFELSAVQKDMIMDMIARQHTEIDRLLNRPIIDAAAINQSTRAIKSEIIRKTTKIIFDDTQRTLWRTITESSGPQSGPAL